MLKPLTVGLLSAAMLSAGHAIALADADDGSIALDFIRHGEAGDNTVINTLVPGPDLTDAGKVQAGDLVTTLQNNHIDVDEIWASTMVRSQETAAPLAESLNMYPLDPTHLLSGLNEIDAGIFEAC
jgi:broad specificity phosphatase PhoE